MATAANSKVHTGHTIEFQVKGNVIGYAQGLDGERSFGTEGVYQIGSIMPAEHVPLRYEGSFSLERFFIRNYDLAKAGYVALGEDILTLDIITIAVYDKATRALIRAYEGCTLVSCRETFRVNAIAGENATFTYMKSSNDPTRK